jgi:hypothetical protein
MRIAVLCDIHGNDAIDAIVSQGIQTLVAPDADRRKEPRPGRRGGLYDFARRLLATDSGKELYLRRQGIVERVFGQVKSNRGVNRFLRRGRAAVRSEWRLLTATHNLLKTSPPPDRNRLRGRQVAPPAAQAAGRSNHPVLPPPPRPPDISATPSANRNRATTRPCECRVAHGTQQRS